jgi:hypothetical protein
MADIFISYAREDDEPFVRKLYEDLRRCGFDIWWDRKAMESRGRTFPQEIRDAIAAAERLVLVVGPQAIASDYVRVEWRFALDNCKVVIPIVRVGDASLAPGQVIESAYAILPPELSTFHCPDFVTDARYEDALKELTRLLSTAVAPLAEVDSVLELPSNYLPRPDVVQRIRLSLLADLYGPVVQDPNARIAAVVGMPGVGKSVAAIAFARDCRTRRAMGDGVYWLRLGRETGVLDALRQFARLTGVSASAVRDVADATAAIANRLADQLCLIVLDDVIDVAAIWPFRNALGSRCRLLFTSRHRRLVAGMGATLVELDVMDELASLDLLARCSNRKPDDLPDEGPQIVKECGRLPLAIAMVGSMLRASPDRWGHALETLRRADLERITGELPDYEYPNLLKAMAVSVDALTPVARARYCDLAVFPEDAAVPELVVKTIWKPAGVDEYEAVNLIDDLANRSLISRDARGQVRIHDLQLDFVRARTTDLVSLHQRLLDAYAITDGWASGPNDGYYLEYLTHHLGEANRVSELVTLLTKSPDWMSAKQRALLSHQSLLTDIDRAARYSADALAHARLGALRAIVDVQTDAYSGHILRALVSLGRIDEAISNARQSATPRGRFDALYDVYEAAESQGIEVDSLGEELLRTADAVTPDRDRSDVLRDLGTLLAPRDTARSARAFRQARVAANRIPALWVRARKLCELGAAVSRTSAVLSAEILDEAWAVVRPRLNDDEITSVQMDVALAFAAARQFDRAIAVTEEMTHSGWQKNSRAYLAKAFAEQDAVDEAMRRMALDSFADDVARPELVAALNRGGRYEDAQAATRRIRDVRHRGPALRAVAKSLAAAGEPGAGDLMGEALRIAERHRDVASRVAEFCNLALDLAAVQDSRSADVITQTVKALSRLPESDRNRPNAMRNVVLTLVRLSRLDEALRLAITIQEADWRASALGILAEELALRADPRAAAVLEQAIAAAIAQNEYSSSDAMCGLATLLARNHQYDGAWQAARAVPDTWTRIDALTALGRLLAEDGDPRAADILAEAMILLPRRAFEPDLADRSAAIGAALFIAGDARSAPLLRRAIQLSRKVTRSGQATRQLARMAGVLSRISHPRADKIIAEAEQAAKSAATSGERTMGLAVLVLEILDTRVPKARTLVQEVTRETIVGGKVIGDHSVYDLAKAYARLGQLDDVRNLVEAMPDGYGRTDAQEKLVGFLSDAGQWDEAWQLARLIGDTTHRALALVQLATATARRKALLAKRTLDEALIAVEAMNPCPLKTQLQARLVVPLVLRRDDRREAHIADARSSDPGHANWSGIHAAAIAESGDVPLALDTYQPRGTDAYIRTLIDWEGVFDGVAPGLAERVVMDAVGIIAWVRPDWRRLHAAILSARDENAAAMERPRPDGIPVANYDTAMLSK